MSRRCQSITPRDSECDVDWVGGRGHLVDMVNSEGGVAIQTNERTYAKQMHVSYVSSYVYICAYVYVYVY